MDAEAALLNTTARCGGSFLSRTFGGPGILQSIVLVHL